MTSFPPDLHSITPAWLDAVIPNIAVTGLTLEPMGEQGLTADMGRLLLQQPSGARVSVIAKCSSSDVGTRKQFRKFYEREVAFYREIAPASNLRVPRCLFAAGAADSHLILLEDMRPSAPGDTVAGIDTEFCLAFATRIAGFHASWWGTEGLVQLREQFPAFGVSFASGYAKVLEVGLALLAPFLDASTVALARELSHGLQGRWDEQWAGPQTMVQWDSHASNVMRPTEQGGDWCVLDWQNCVVGSGIWDVTRFCVLSLPTAQRRDGERDIIATYARALADHGVLISPPSLWSAYRRFMPLMFAQQLRFLTSITTWDETRLAWREAVVPRVVAALQDAGESD